MKVRPFVSPEEEQVSLRVGADKLLLMTFQGACLELMLYDSAQSWTLVSIIDILYRLAEGRYLVQGAAGRVPIDEVLMLSLSDFNHSERGKALEKFIASHGQRFGLREACRWVSLCNESIVPGHLDLTHRKVLWTSGVPSTVYLRIVHLLSR